MTEILEPLNAIELRAKPVVSAIEVAAHQLAVVDKASADHAGEMLRHIAETKRRIEAEFEPTIQAAHQAHKAALAFKAKVVAPFTVADQIARHKLLAWQTDEQRKAVVEARRLEEAENVRRMREWEAEQQRVRAENERLAAERKAQLDAAAAMHDTSQFAALQAAPVLAEPPPPPPQPAFIAPAAPAKVEGFSQRTTWECQVVDAAAIPRAFLIPDMKALDALARAQGKAFNVPGCRAVPKTSTAVRA